MQLAADGTRQISLSKNQYDSVTKVLNSFYKQTKCGVIMLSDISGLAVAMRGTLNQQNLSVLSSLAAGNYAATAEIARLINEESSFTGQYHEGKTQSIYLKGINDDFFVTVVFGKNITFGMVRVLVEKVIEQLGEILSAQEETISHEEETVSIGREEIDKGLNKGLGEERFDESFKDELCSRLDAILGK